jgi:hypothetical protein
MLGAVPFEIPVDYVDNGNGIGRPVYANTNSRVKATFVRLRKVNEQASLRAGKEVYDDEIVLIKQIAGDTNVAANRATEADKLAFREEWARFQRGDGVDVGTPLGHLYGVGPATMAIMFGLGIATVQAASKMSDQMCSVVGEQGERVRALAQVYLNSRASEAESASALIEAKATRARNVELEAECARLRAELESKPKRTKKEKIDA